MPPADTTALYLRISKDDNNDADSESILGQRNMLMDYIHKHEDLCNTRIIEIADDGFSGANFDRPGVKRLLDLARDRKIQTIMVKDFSRFGRAYIQVGDYVEQIFPFLGIRFISVSDNYDSVKPECGAGSIDTAFKHIMHAYYVKDLSIKMRTAKRTLMERGAFISPYAIFGYKKAADKHKLEIDEPAASIVRRIFALVIQGHDGAETARILNSDGVITPNVYKQSIGCSRDWNFVTDKNQWTESAVLKVIKDMRYTGCVVGGKTYRLEPGSVKVGHRQRSEWHIRPNMHEPIISADDFDRARKSLRQINGYLNITSQRDAFSHKLICAVCGHALIKIRKGSDCYSCRYGSYSPKGGCFPGPINIADIECAIMAGLRAHMAAFINEEELRRKAQRDSKLSVNALDAQIKQMNRQLDKLKMSRRVIYERYADGNILKEDYFSQRGACESQITALSDRLEELDKTKKILEQPKENPALKALIEACGGNAPDKQIIDAFVEKILVYDAKRVEIVWKFQNEFIISSL